LLEKLKVEVEVEEKNRLQNLLNCQQADAQREVLTAHVLMLTYY